MFQRALTSELLQEAAEKLTAGTTLRLTGLWGSSAPLVAAALGQIRQAPILFIAKHPDDADDIADDIEVFTGKAAHLLPAWEVDIGTDHINDEIKSFLKVAITGGYTMSVHENARKITIDETVILEKEGGTWKITETIDPWS